MSTSVDVGDADNASAISSEDSVAVTVCENHDAASPMTMLAKGVEGIAVAYLMSSSVTFCSS